MNNLISIIIVNYNGKKWLQKCFDSLVDQTYKNFEVIFVDNNSVDDSIEFLEKNYSDKINLKIVKSDKNLGFAGGNNLGYENSDGEYVILLNNDTCVEKKYLENFTKAFSEIPNLGCAQSKIILMNDKQKLDVVGSYWTSSSFLYHFGFYKNQEEERYNEVIPVFSNKGASIILRREIIEKIGLFDNDFWCYYEETDLCNRLWSAGYECWYYPKAVCYHANGGTSLTFGNDFIQFHNFKNKLLSFLKNFEIITLIKIIPVYLLINILLSIFWLFQGKFKHFMAIYRAIFWNIKNIKTTLEKRKIIKNLRTKKDKEIFLKTKKNPRLSYYLYLFINLKKYKD